MIANLLKNSSILFGKNQENSKEKSIRENMDEICEILENEILSIEVDDETKKEMLKKLRIFTSTKTNIMIVGATGAGKSSTINALFNCGSEKEIEDEEEDYVEFAKVGSKADPETKDIEKYTLGKLVLWDTPGLGDGTELDEHHKEIIQELLREEDEDGNALIDLVLVILDGSTKDLGTSYKILNEVIIPELGAENGRILVALNQADIAMKTGQHWNYEENEPDEILTQFLEEKLISITKRIEMDSKLLINPVYYCAGYKEENGETVHPYNLSKLLYYILNSIPSHKRIAIMESINTNSDNYEYNDEDIDYGEAVSYSFMKSFEYLFSTGIDMGAEKGRELLGIPGAVIGGLIGGTVGCIKGLINKIFK